MRSAPLRTIRLPTLLMAATIAAVASAAPAQAAEKVRLAQNQSPISGVSIIADRKGFFANNGLDVEVFNFTTGKQCLDTVMAAAPISPLLLKRRPPPPPCLVKRSRCSRGPSTPISRR
jgi:ABC-type nitrate/sulfonate/bicarbonate transport system substrate-binding protein